MQHPNWAMKYKTPGTELRHIGGKYYLYKITSKWNPQKKRAQKITEKFLGRITKEKGLIKSKTKEQITTIQSKAYGVCDFLINHMRESISALKKYFPNHWEQIVAGAMCRLLHQSPLKNMNFFYQSDYMSELFNCSLNPKQMTSLLKTIGGKRDKILGFFGEFIKPDLHLLIDVTNMHSRSSLLPLTKIG